MALIGPRINWRPTTRVIFIPPPPDPGPVKSGITLGLFPFGFGYDVELWRSTQASTGAGSSSKWGRIATLTRGVNSEIVYQDVLLQSTKSYSYRARQNFPGFSPSAWTTVVSGRPVVIGTELSVNPPSFGSTAFRQLKTISTGDNTLTTGVGLGSSGVKRTLVFPCQGFMPLSSTVSWKFAAGYLSVDAAATTAFHDYFLPIPLPQSVTVTKFSARTWCNSNSTLNSVTVDLYRNSTVDGSVTLLATMTQRGTSGWQTLNSSAMSEVVAGNPYMIEAVMQRSPTGSVRFLSAAVSYTRTKVQHSY